MDIQYQISGLILICLLLFLLYRHSSLRLYTKNFYVVYLGVVSICIVIHLFVISLYMQGDMLDTVLCQFVSKTYMVALTAVSYSVLMYIITDIYVQDKDRIRKLCLYISPLAIVIISMCLIPMEFTVEEKVTYMTGPCVMIMMIAVIYYLIACIVYCTVFKKKMVPQKRESAWLLIIMWIASAALQLNFRTIYVIDFILAAAAVYMYIQLENPANYLDKETEVFNSFAYSDYVQRATELGKQFSAISLHVDGMRFINENFGLDNGKILRKRIGSYLTSFDKVKVFRSAENEFTLIISDLEKSKDMLGQIKNRFDYPWKISDVDFKMEYEMVYMPSNFVLDDLDTITGTMHYFMTECRKKGSNLILQVDDEALKRRRIIKDAEKVLRWAIENNKVQMYYQPIYNVKTGKFSSAEALVRIVDENQNFVMPDVFIPIAEQNGLIVELGQMIVEKVCQFMKEAQLSQYGLEYMEINLSVIQCMQETMAEQLKQTITEYGLPANCINFEITESTAVNSEYTLINNMNRLIEFGSTFSLDDFGSGYSNLSYIVNLPFHIVKMDKSMVWNYNTSDKTKVALDYSVAMLQKLGIKILTEGIETKEQLEAMKLLKVDFVQGYYFSRPLPQTEYLEFILKNN